MTLVARRQRLAGDLAGARETLELADRILGDHPEMRLRTLRAFEVASEQIAAGDLDGALKTAERIDPGRRAPVLATIAFEQARAGDLEAFRTTLDEAVPLTKIPPEPIENQPGNRPAFRTYLEASPTSIRLLTLGLDALLEYIRSTEDEDERGRLVTDLGLARSMAGDVAWALEFSRSLDSPGRRRRALYSLVSGIDARLELEEQTSHQIDKP